jgi:hypothetical protein
VIRGVVPACALVLALAAAAPAQAGILAPEDAAELAQSLAEAQEEQGVCYGWNVTNNFDGTPDVGSGTGGPGAILIPTTCTKGYVQLEGSIDYACDTCESEDSASVSINSSFPNGPTVKDLEALGLRGGALTGDDDDTTLINMVNALPLLVADRGLAPYLEYEQATTVPATDHATNKPGSDFLRDTWIQILLFVGLILGGPGFFLYKRRQLRESPPEPEDVSPPASPPAQPSAPPPATT